MHRILELSVGAPLFVLGGWGILADVMAYMWILEDPEHGRGFVGVGTMIGILPFIMGCWLVIMAVKRSCSQSPAKSPESTPDPPSESN